MTYRAQRWPVDGNVHLRGSAGVDYARLRNIAPRGVCVQTSLCLGVRQKVSVTLVGRSIDATVVWGRNGLFGMRFDAALTHSDIAVLRKLPKTAVRAFGVAGHRAARNAGLYTEL